MRRFYSAFAAIGLLLSACGASERASAPESSGEPIAEAEIDTPTLMNWADLTSRPLPTPTETLRYGETDTAVIDLWLPDTSGPHPVVLMVHGGCWQKAIADRNLMNYAAEDLRQSGFAVWNIEYRGVDEDGGGYPGTFLDVAAAADHLGRVAGDYDLDLSRVAGFGHSAGGHLVAWLAGRSNLPTDSPLYAQDPLSMRGLINSGGLADLEQSAPVTLDTCLAAIMDQLTGVPTPERPNVFAETSAAELLPTAAIQISVNGAQDRIAPPELGEAYMTRILGVGGQAALHIVPETGHVELIAPGTAAFDLQTELLETIVTSD